MGVRPETLRSTSSAAIYEIKSEPTDVNLLIKILFYHIKCWIYVQFMKEKLLIFFRQTSILT